LLPDSLGDTLTAQEALPGSLVAVSRVNIGKRDVPICIALCFHYFPQRDFPGRSPAHKLVGFERQNKLYTPAVFPAPGVCQDTLGVPLDFMRAFRESMLWPDGKPQRIVGNALAKCFRQGRVGRQAKLTGIRAPEEWNFRVEIATLKHSQQMRDTDRSPFLMEQDMKGSLGGVAAHQMEVPTGGRLYHPSFSDRGIPLLLAEVLEDGKCGGRARE